MNRLGATLLLVVLVLLPSVAAPLSWSAKLGLDYSRDDRWNLDGYHTTSPALDLTLDLDAGGQFLDATTGQWHAAAQYLRRTHGPDGAESVSDALTYRGEARFFLDRRSPLKAAIHASRTRGDSVSDWVPGSSTSLSTSWGGGVNLGLPNRPTLSLSYDRIDVENSGPQLLASTLSLDTLSASSRFGTSAFSYDAQYRGEFSEGTFPLDNHQTQRVNVTSRVEVSPAVTATINDGYSLREPTTTSRFNPWEESNVFETSVRYQVQPAEFQQVRYRFHRGLRLAPSMPDQRREAQLLGYLTQQQTSNPAWRYRIGANLAYGRTQVGATDTVTAGQSLSGLALWSPGVGERRTEFRAGPTVALLEAAGDVRVGYGATAGTTLTRAFLPYRLTVLYDVTYGADVDANPGWSLSQAGSAQLQGPLASGNLTSTLSVSSSRASGPLLGERASRSLQAQGGYGWSTHGISLRAGLSENVNLAFDESLVGDGLLVAPYDTRSANVGFGAHTLIRAFLALDGRADYSQSHSPDRPDTTRLDLRGAITVSYGVLRISLEDRYTLADVGAGDTRYNLLMVRIFRIFGSTF